MSRDSIKFHTFQDKQDSFPLLTIHSIWKQQIHRFCHPNFCINRKSELCMTERMKKYLTTQFNLRKFESENWYKGPTNSSDLACLERALAPEYKNSVFQKEILTELGLSRSHRLRFKEQKTLAKNCFEKIIDSLDAFCREMNLFGDSPLQVYDLFRNYFKKNLRSYTKLKN